MNALDAVVPSRPCCWAAASRSGSATSEEHAAFTSELGREAHRTYVRAVAEARAAVARASAYDPSLRKFLDVGSRNFVAAANEITEALRRRVA
ncbi:MAG TPA: hypothetical protein VF519_16185 [Mycobacteriales bacterium]